MTPYYDKDGITIYCGDCREVLPMLGLVDLVLTDPPYGINSSGKNGIGRDKGNYEKNFCDDANYLREVVVPVISDLIARIGCVVLTPGNRNFMLYPQPQSFGCFWQPAAVGLQTFGNVDAQPIFYYGKNASKKCMGVPCSYKLVEPPSASGHPCAKPIKAWTKLLSNISLPGQCVFDPFVGSGTTLRAAKDIGRCAIGVEIEERYCEISARRLEQGILQFE